MTREDRTLLNHREILAGTTAAVLASCTRLGAADVAEQSSETAVKELYESLSETQRSQMCFDWNHVDPSVPSRPKQ